MVAEINHEDAIAGAVFGRSGEGEDGSLGREEVVGHLFVPRFLAGGQVEEDQGRAFVLLLLFRLLGRLFGGGLLLGALCFLLLFGLLLHRHVGHPASVPGNLVALDRAYGAGLGSALERHHSQRVLRQGVPRLFFPLQRVTTASTGGTS